MKNLLIVAMALYLPWVDKITNWIKSFIYVIANFVVWIAAGLENIKQFPDQVKIRLISLLIKGILRILQNLLKYFNGTAVSTSFALFSHVLVFTCFE